MGKDKGRGRDERGGDRDEWVTGGGDEGRKWEAGKVGEIKDMKGRRRGGNWEGYGNLAPMVVSKSWRLCVCQTVATNTFVVLSE